MLLINYEHYSSELYHCDVMMMELCELCGRLAHHEKERKDQCRLFTAILGRGWGWVIESCVVNKPDEDEHESEKSSSMSSLEEEPFFTPDTSFSD